MSNFSLVVDQEYQRSLPLPDKNKFQWSSFELDHSDVAEWLSEVSENEAYLDNYVDQVISWMNRCDESAKDMDDAVFLFGCVEDVEGYALPDDENVIARWMRIPSIVNSPLSVCIAKNPLTPQDVLLSLSMDRERSVRRALLTNPKVTAEMRVHISLLED